MRRFLLVLGLFLAACSGDDGGEDAAPSTTSTAPAATSTTAAEATTTTAPAEEPSTDLEDGEHPGFFDSLDVSGRVITVDVVQFLTGEEARAAYEEETGDAGGPPNDYFIVNENSRLRALPVAEDADVRILAEPGGPDLAEGTFDDLANLGENSGVLLWVTLDDGVVTEIEEQFLP